VLAFVRGTHELAEIRSAVRDSVKAARETTRSSELLRRELSGLRTEVESLRREVRDRLLQNTLVMTRTARALDSGTAQAPGTQPGEVRLSGSSVPMTPPQESPLSWDLIGGHPDPEGREWLTLDRCSACGHEHFTVVSPWNKLILLDKAPDDGSARYDYAVCHGCGVLFATRRPTGQRYQFLLEHFGEVTAKRGSGGTITNHVLNPAPLTDAHRGELRRLASRGVFVSDHLGLRKNEYLAPLLRDRFENSAHTDIIGSLLSPRRWRVLEVRSRAGTILDGLRRAWDAEVFAMPIWESQQFLLREVFAIETSELIEFERFQIPFDGPFDLIICNHMFTHAVRPQAFFAEIRAKLRPGGHVYLHNEPDDQEFLIGGQSMLATMNPLHLQAFDQAAIMRALAANGFHVSFQKHARNETQFCLATMGEPAFAPMSESQRNRRVAAYQRAFDRAVLRVDEHIRPRFAGDWTKVIERAVASGVAEFDERGHLRLVGR
jgi:SAM-dependent methyltransferase